jgi:preprotein translocase subunit SecD
MRQRFTPAIAILLLISVGLACSLLRGKRPLTWHIILEIDSAVPDRESTVKQTAAVIERRLDSAGVYNFEVLAQGTPPNGRILVNLPEVSDRERLKKLITAGGRLELTAVISPPSPSPVQTYNTKEEAAASLGGTVPANRRVLPYSERSEPTRASETSSEAGRQPTKWVVVASPAIVDGSDLRNASAVQSRAGSEDYQIAFSLKAEGADKFGAWTGAHINDYIGVVLNGEIKSIAYIKSQITDQGEIMGRFTKPSAEDLAWTLRSGALPAPVKIVEEGANK